jgi:CRISPR type III-A-associated RAMP protein Csm5
VAETISDNYGVKIKPITPVHIGSGREYFPYEYDPTLEKGRILISDLDLCLCKHPAEAAKFGEPKPLWKLNPGLLKRHPDLVRNREQIADEIAKELRTSAEKDNAATIWEFAKTSESQPYIPGSSLKGAVRTAVAYCLLKDLSEIRNGVRRAVVRKSQGRLPTGGDKDAVERFVFRDNGDAKDDLMRLWSFSDSKPLARDGTLSVVLGTRVTRSKKLGFQNYYEVLVANSPEAETAVRFDSSLAGSNYWSGSLFERFPKTLDALRTCIGRFADDIIDYETDYFTEERNQMRGQLKDVSNLYANLRERSKRGEILLPLGKGTGWIRKTVGLLFRKDDLQTFKDIFFAYRLGKRNQPAESFPSSREIVDGNQLSIFGWAQLLKAERPS